MGKILDYLTRGKSLNTILFVLVLAIIRELTALETDGQIVAILKELQNQDIGSLKNTAISIAIVVMSGGSYITLALLIILFIVVCFLKYNEKRNDQIPNLKIEFKYRANQKTNEKISQLNKRNNEGVMILKPTTALYVFKFTWEYILTIRNNSSFHAYNPKLYILDKFDDIQRGNYINTNQPIIPNSNLEIKLDYEFLKDVNGKESMEIVNKRYPSLITHFELLVEYENENGKKFYTLYEHTAKTNSKLKRKPKKYKTVNYEVKVESERTFLM